MARLVPALADAGLLVRLTAADGERFAPADQHALAAGGHAPGDAERPICGRQPVTAAAFGVDIRRAVR
jgi:hypothetical protein